MTTSRTSNLLSRGLDYLNDNLSEFRIAPGASDARLLKLMKPLAELGLTATIVGFRNSLHYEQCRRLIEFCWNQLQEGEAIVGFLRRNPDFLIYATVYPPFLEWGIENSRIMDTVRSLVRASGFRAVELPAWRALDLSITLRRMGIDVDEPSTHAIRTWLFGLHDPWTIRESTAYSVTHTVFYLTDFGMLPNALPQPVSDYLREWLPVWTEAFRRQNNLDLVSELKMVSHCIHTSEPDSKAWRDVLDSQHADGAIPGPAGAGQNIDSGELSDRRRRFLENYHTTLVAMMAASFLESASRKASVFDVSGEVS